MDKLVIIGKGKERRKIIEKLNSRRIDVFLFTDFTEMLSDKCLWIKNSWIILQNKVELQMKAILTTKMFPNTNIVKQKVGEQRGKGKEEMHYPIKENK